MTDQMDRFQAAVKVLAGHGHIKQRLINAFQSNLDEIDADELPLDMQQEFEKLKYLMHRVAPLNGEGPICASVRKMSETEASECAVSVVSLYDEILRRGRAETVQASPPPPAEDEAERIPPFLIKSV